MNEMTHLIEENEYLKQKLSVLHQQNASLQAKQNMTVQALKESLEMVRQEVKRFAVETV